MQANVCNPIPYVPITMAVAAAASTATYLTFSEPVSFFSSISISIPDRKLTETAAIKPCSSSDHIKIYSFLTFLSASAGCPVCPFRLSRHPRIPTPDIPVLQTVPPWAGLPSTPQFFP